MIFDRHDHSAQNGETANETPPQGFLHFAFAPSQVWKSKISWRLTLTIFTTILFVQMAVLIFTSISYKKEQLSGFRQTARTMLVSVLEKTAEQSRSPLSDDLAEKLITGAAVEGIAIYDLDYRPIKSFGSAVFLNPKSAETLPDNYRSVDPRYYEFLFRPADLTRPYNIVVRLNAEGIAPKVEGHVRQTVLILILMAGLVTSVLMLALGEWILEPLMVLRNNLLSAAQSPEKPDVRRLKKELDDEIGIANRIANDLIRQNANNLKRLRSQAEDKIHKLAYYDTLTGLPNRTFFLEKLENHIKHRVIEEDRKLAVFMVDIDHFKDINDTMGHEIGDRLLEAIGKRLVKAMPEDAVVARSSADEFTAMVVLKANQADSSPIVDGIFAAMIEPVSILQERFQVRVSIGVAQCPDDGMESRQILKNADIALNRAKEEGRDTVRYYSQDFDRAVQARFQMLRDLRVAMDKNQLRLHYHPQFDLKTGALIGAEVLLRWWKPDQSKEGGRFIPPIDFIPVAEQSSLIVPIGEYVLREACKMGKSWQERGLPPFRIAVNISGVQFHRGDIVTMVDSVLKETQIQPHLLELEVTESVFMENMQVAIDILNQLHKRGVELAVDDFGTGYSSLSYLRQFPIDRLKIDQSFVRNALVNQDDRMIAKTIITLGHSLGLKVIAEGVETTDHENFLKEEGCDEVQGFKYSKPIPADAFFEFALAHNRNLAKSGKLSLVETSSK